MLSLLPMSDLLRSLLCEIVPSYKGRGVPDCRLPFIGLVLALCRSRCHAHRPGEFKYLRAPCVNGRYAMTNPNIMWWPYRRYLTENLH